MREAGTLKGVLILFLVVSIIVNTVVLWDNYKLSLSNEELDKSYRDLKISFNEFNASFDELNREYWELNRTYWDKSYQNLKTSYDELKTSFDELNQKSQELAVRYSDLEVQYLELEKSFLGLFEETFSPPVSKIYAILIALKQGEWNSSNLKGMVVIASLRYVRFWATKLESGFEVLHEVKNPVSDYSPVVEGDVTYRYVWYVIVAQAGPWRSIPPPGSYFVDAATGEIVPRGMF